MVNLLRVFAAIVVLLGVPGTGAAQEKFITLASTTSTDNSGLFAAILPRFQAQTGISVRVVAVGTGQAIRLAERGDADVLLVHHKPSEEKFIAQGFGVTRYDVMYNDFVIVGPSTDPANISGLPTAAGALKNVAAAGAIFVSRGDDSGTHKAEQRLWQAAAIDPVSAGKGSWYREVGAGMGAALNIATGLGGYILTDRGTWVSFANKGSQKILVEGDAALFNQYGVIAVNPARHAHVKSEEANAFVGWLTGAAGQAAIAAFRRSGQQLFTPNASTTPAN